MGQHPSRLKLFHNQRQFRPKVVRKFRRNFASTFCVGKNARICHDETVAKIDGYSYFTELYYSSSELGEDDKEEDKETFLASNHFL